MHHYTYLLTNVQPSSSKRYYIGVRSCNCFPHDDIYYMSSSKIIKKIIKEADISNFNKIIIQEFDSRQAANNHEINLHLEYNVVKNPIFYNNARALNNRFCGGSETGIKKRMKTINDSKWQETIGKESNKKHSNTISNPLWKETTGKIKIQKYLETINNSKWQNTVGIRKGKKIKKTKLDPNWKKTVGKEQIQKQKKTKLAPVWKETKGKEK